MKKFEHPNPDANVVDDLFLNSPNCYWFEQQDEPPTKENSLYLTITQTSLSFLGFLTFSIVPKGNVL